ncbi:MAG: tetratricopeptide repeat protein [Bacteroidota bacterium]
MHTLFRSCLLISLFLITLCLSAQHPALDSMKRIAPTQSGTVQIGTWHEMAFLFIYFNIDSAQILGEKSLVQAQKLGEDSLVAESYLYLGMHANRTSQQKKAIEYYLKGIKIHQREGHAGRVASFQANLGSAYHHLGRFTEGLEMELKALDYYEEVNDLRRMQILLSNIAEAYASLEDYQSQLAYARKALALGYTLHVPQKGTSFSSLGKAFLNLSENNPVFLDSAILYFHKAVDNFAQFPDPQNEAAVYNNLGYSLRLQGKHQASLQAFREGVQLSRRMNKHTSTTKNFNNMALSLMELNRLDEAARYLDSAQLYMKRSDELSAYEAVHSSMGKLAEKSNQPAKALEWFKVSYDLRDTLLNRERVRVSTEMTEKYESAKKDQQIAEQKADLLTSKRQQEQVIWGSLLVILILGVLGLLLFYRYRLQQQARRNAERLEEQQLRVNATLQAQEDERGRLARDLHDAVGQVLAATRLQFGAFDKAIQSPAYHQALLNLDQACTDVRSIAHLMMPRTLEVEGLPAAIREMADKIIRPTGLAVQVDVLGQIHSLPENLRIGAYRIVQELVQNTLKHAQAHMLDIQLVFRAKQLIIRVEDDGIGMSEAGLTRGHGLSNIQLRASAMKATFSFENSSKSSGTRATLHIPI